MTDPLYVQPDGVRSYAQIHDEVVAALSQVMGTAVPEVLGVETTHGPIASAVSGALSQVLGSRQGTLQATSTSAQTISELLQKAAQMYEQGDQKGAETLKAAAKAMQNANAAGRTSGAAGTAGVPGTAGAGSAGAGGGADMVGQMVSQVGQQVGQMAQSIAQPLQGLAQGLQQFPQQVMQGAQQVAQQVSQAAGTAGEKAPGDPSAHGDGDSRRRKAIRLRRVTPPMPAGRPTYRAASVPSRHRRVRSRTESATACGQDRRRRDGADAQAISPGPRHAVRHRMRRVLPWRGHLSRRAAKARLRRAGVRGLVSSLGTALL
jgi:hypothetical protein